jgi:hypothetical protein
VINLLVTFVLLLGNAFSIADAACFHPLWFARNCPELSAAIDARPALTAWLARIEAFGPGEVEPLSAADALDVARAAEPADVSGGARAGAFAPGDAVAISADDYGVEECRGTVARVRADEIVVLREDPAVGRIAVHFPLAGYRVRRAP